MIPTRDGAWRLLTEHTRNESLLKHALAVEAAMRAYAVKQGEDLEKYSVVGLLHDFDYEQYPDPKDHPRVGASLLKQAGYPDEYIHAVLSHAEHTGEPRLSLMDKTLFAVDELCGFITAATLVRPGRNVCDLPVSSVRKRLKDKAFARSVNREEIVQGAAELGVDLDEHIGFVIAAMCKAARELGLAGE
jgi:putative nucleotidyltransferase with HDIG domain